MLGTRKRGWTLWFNEKRETSQTDTSCGSVKRKTGLFGMSRAHDMIISMLMIQRYRHTVTNAISHIYHPEHGGGVLADDMGMGKSLSILSLVAKTSDQTDDWLHNSQNGEDDSIGTTRTRVKATLIIVPSASKLEQASC
jgi:hypothetical protein